MTKYLKLSLILLFLVQLLVAGNFDLAHDEAYYWLFSKNLDWGYFDHPPFMAMVIKFFSFLPHSEISVRIGFIILQFLTLFILLRLTDPKRHKIVAILFFAFPLASLTGLLAIPDMPLLFMTACYCYGLRDYFEKKDLYSAAKLGVIIPLLLYAKYHGILLIFFTILACPKILLRRDFYLVALISVIVFLPHIYWQYKHDFSTLHYHFVERPSAKFSTHRVFEYLGIQLALAGVFVGPVVWWIVIKFKPDSSFDRAMKFISIGTVLFFLLSSFSKKVESNWTIFLAVPLIYLVANSSLWEKFWVKRLLYTSASFVILARVLFIVPYEYSSLKRINEFQGWRKWTHKVKAMCGDREIMANTYQVASKLSYYLNQNVPALNLYSRKNQFDYWLFQNDLKTQDVCYLTDKIEFTGLAAFTPDGKEIKVIKNVKLVDLLKLKEKDRSRKN